MCKKNEYHLTVTAPMERDIQVKLTIWDEDNNVPDRDRAAELLEEEELAELIAQDMGLEFPEHYLSYVAMNGDVFSVKWVFGASTENQAEIDELGYISEMLELAPAEHNMDRERQAYDAIRDYGPRQFFARYALYLAAKLDPPLNDRLILALYVGAANVYWRQHSLQEEGQ